MAHVESPCPSSASHGYLTRGALLIMLVLVAAGAFQLWSEFCALGREQDNLIHSRIIGFEGINFDVNHAEKPAGWLHDEGDSTLLWSDWEPGVGHHWFRFRRGELAPWSLQGGMGRDSIRTIFRPVVEIGGGRRWVRIPGDAPVAAFDLDGVACAYPLIVLQKTLAVHDVINGRSFLVTFAPAVPADQAIRLFDLTLDGQPLAMGHSGSFLDGRSVLYDRQSKSLWLPGPERLEAIAGRHRGSHLSELVRPVLAEWSDWQTHHPDGRLLVGADRRGDPID
jgi:hypothetical protein